MTIPLRVVITDYEYETLTWEEEALAQIGAEFIKCQCQTEQELIEATCEADAILVQYANITRNVIAQMKKCRAIVRYGVGLDCIDLNAATDHGIMVANIPDYGLEDIADHAIALMLTVARKIVQLNQAVHEGVWDYKLAKPLYRLRGKTMGLIGFGRIARMVADKAKVFGMDILAHDPYVDQKTADLHQVKLADLETVLRSADVLSLHVPVTEQTIHLINEDILAKIKRNSLLINTARGALVDEAALFSALKVGRIAGAGLDVSEREPIAPDNKLLTLPNVVITPHSAWYTEEAQASLQQQAAQEIVRVLLGETPLNLANPAVLTKISEGMIEVGNVLRVHEDDSVVIAASPLTKGTVIADQNEQITLLSDIPMGHKIATRDIKKGENVIRYGNPIGHAIEDIRPGDYVHTHNVKTNLSDVVAYEYQPNLKPLEVQGEMPTFEGYRRPDGKVGIRNEIWVIPTVFCANGPVQRIVELANQKYPRTENFDGFYALTHPNGCSQMGEDLLNTQKILANLAKHPNAGGVLLVSLGCEVNSMDVFLPVLGDFDPQRIKTMISQEVEDEIAIGMELIDQLYNYVTTFKRETQPLSELVLAVNCGGSDGFSGITANAVLGRVTDMITGWGGTVIMTEVPEMFGAEHILMNRAADREVFDKIVALINDYKNYFKKYGQVIYENPTQGNMAGGISTLEEKSLGCIQKGGQAVVTDVLKYGETIKTKGFILISGPGNDLVGITNQEAAGAVVTVFTTGRGTPSGFAVPLIRMGSNSTMSNWKTNWIDYNAGVVLEGKDFNQAAQEMLALILEVASGQKQSLAEANGYRQIGMLRDGVTN